LLIIPGHLKKQGKVCVGFSNGCEIGIEIFSNFVLRVCLGLSESFFVWEFSH
jgi:hypothetical protein